MNQHQQTAIYALQTLKGDDAARARLTFRRCTAEEMQQEHGYSGKTRAAILAEYEVHENRVLAAIEWIKTL